MSVYVFADITLEVRPAELEARIGLASIWTSLSWVPIDVTRPRVHPQLLVRLQEGSRDVPSTANLLFQADGFSIFEDGSDCYVTDGFSTFHLKRDQLEGHAYLHPSFYSKPAGLQCNFWSFGLMKLLRSTGFYSVHAAAVAAHETYGILIAGPSGSGKS